MMDMDTRCLDRDGPGIAASPDDITPEWITEVLRADGTLSEGKVTRVDVKRIGNGVSAISVRIKLTYDEARAGLPGTLVGKLAGNRDPITVQANMREVLFYKDLAPRTSMHTSRTYFAGIDLQSGDSTILFEDLSPARERKQLEGCSVDDAETALLEAAALHAAFWEEPKLAALDWLVPLWGQLVPLFEPGAQRFKEHFGSALEPECIALLDSFPAAAKAIVSDRSEPLTLQHGDFRLDNVLYDVRGGERRMTTFDWQGVNFGPGLTDVAFFLGSGLSPDDRRMHERELVRRYHGELVKLGVGNYDFEQCWRGYRRQCAHGLMTAIVTFYGVPTDDASRKLLYQLALASCLQIIDNKTFEP